MTCCHATVCDSDTGSIAGHVWTLNSERVSLGYRRGRNLESPEGVPCDPLLGMVIDSADRRGGEEHGSMCVKPQSLRRGTIMMYLAGHSEPPLDGFPSGVLFACTLGIVERRGSGEALAIKLMEGLGFRMSPVSLQH